MATLHIKTPNGKTLNVNVPEGTPPEAYDKLADDALDHYKRTLSPADAAGEGADYPNQFHTTFGPSADVAMTIAGAPGMVKGGVALAKAAPGAVKAIPGAVKAVAKGAGTLAEDFSGGIGKGAEALGGVVKKGWNALTNNTPRGLGFDKAHLKTPGARAAAYENVEFANAAHPEVGELVTGASKRPINLPGDAPALPTAEKGLATADDVAGFKTPGEAPTDLPAPNVDAFNNPIRSGMTAAPEEMLESAVAQRNSVGKAIENVLAKYDQSGSFYDPKSFNSKIKSMLERDAAGNPMTTGWQGEVNEAIRDAASSINDYAVNGPIRWSDAARIKSGMQAGSKYGVQGLKHSEEAYKQVASLLKQDIDDQAMAMLQKSGGDVAQYQQLRQYYGKYDSLSDALNNAASRTAANSPIPWWVKMAAGAAIGSTGLGVVRGLTGL